MAITFHRCGSHLTLAGWFPSAAVAFSVAAASASNAQELPPRISREDLAKDNKLFLTLASKEFRWEAPTEPVRIAGPVYFVGTQGLGSYLIVTSEGHILLNTGMPSSGPMIADAVKKLGFDIKDIKIIINSHAHSDHAGAIAYMKERSGAKVAIMREDVRAIEDGGKDDFHYGSDWKVMGFPPCQVDRVLRDRDTIKMGDVLLTAIHTPGHTRGATTWVANIQQDGKPLVVAWPDGAGFNPGYRVAKDPSYPGITEDFRRTLHTLEMLKPDIFLAAHCEYFGFEEKRQRVGTEGVKAWINPEEYRRWVASKRRAFEDQVDREMGDARPEASAPAPRADGSTVPVTVQNFIRAETDFYFGRMVEEKGGIGTFGGPREFTPIDVQNVVRMNRDTFYSSGVFDLDAAPVTITLPNSGKRYMAMQIINQDHYTVEVVYAPGRHVYTKEKVGTRYAFAIVRTLADPGDTADVRAANGLRDAIKVEQAAPGKWEVPNWDPTSQKSVRDALAVLGSHQDGEMGNMFGTKSEVDPVRHLIGTAIGWGGNPLYAAAYSSFHPPLNNGTTAYMLTLKDVPVDGFWSVSVYNEDGYFEKNDQGMYSLNNLTAKPNGDGSYTIWFGGPKDVTNRLPIMHGWNYTVRLYRPRKEVLDGSWTIPEARPVK